MYMLEPRVIYEDKNFLAINKPAGLVVHGTAHSKEPTLVDWLLKRCPEIATVGDEPELRPGIVHRLDKETSGVMLVARNQKSFDYLKNLFKNRLIKKIYLAVVFGKLIPRSGRIEKAIGIKNGTLKRSVHSERMKKDALTEYSVKKYFERDGQSGGKEYFSLVEVEPKTGRTHQIRVHLASVGHPVLGDKLYGLKNQPASPEPERGEPVWAGRLMLHALSLELPLQNGSRLKIEADPPDDFQKTISSFGD